MQPNLDRCEWINRLTDDRGLVNRLMGSVRYAGRRNGYAATQSEGQSMIGNPCWLSTDMSGSQF